MLKYCKNLFQYERRPTFQVKVGKVFIGSKNPILVQSMTDTPTDDVTRSTEQIMRIADAGGELVRLTAQGEKQAKALSGIKSKLISEGYDVPLSADIHFNPEAAFTAAKYVEKIRINPGNFAHEDEIDEKFGKLLILCKEYDRAIRIGVNHGSLSDRMMEKWGDTPRGMVESALEYLRICRKHDFQNVVVSFKSSNVRTMVEAYRLGAAMMDEEGLKFPLHLGVTEAGADDDGRIKSAVGIGSLLCDGLGDTIRVSLTENPENEIPVARAIIDYCSNLALQNYIPVEEEPLPYNPYEFSKRSNSIPEVITKYTPTVSIAEARAGAGGWVRITLEELNYATLEWLENNPDRTLVLTSDNNNWTAEIRAVFVKVMRRKIANPIMLKRCYQENDLHQLIIKSAIDFGSALIDGFGDGVWIENNGEICKENLGLSILQATRMRITRTEIISCPGCGRTLFDLQTTARKVKERLGNRAGLKIAVMGCIVNGPGEMADADYGYVGSAAGRVTLYRGREVVERGIPQEIALERLVQLIDSDQADLNDKEESVNAATEITNNGFYFLD